MPALKTARAGERALRMAPGALYVWARMGMDRRHAACAARGRRPWSGSASWPWTRPPPLESTRQHRCGGAAEDPAESLSATWATRAPREEECLLAAARAGRLEGGGGAAAAAAAPAAPHRRHRGAPGPAAAAPARRARRARRRLAAVPAQKGQEEAQGQGQGEGQEAQGHQGAAQAQGGRGGGGGGGRQQQVADQLQDAAGPGGAVGGAAGWMGRDVGPDERRHLLRVRGNQGRVRDGARARVCGRGGRRAVRDA